VAGATGAGGGSGGTGGVGGCGACATGQTCVTDTCMNINCTAGATVAPISALITDFSDAVPDPVAPGEFRYGGTTPSRVHGGTARFSNAASPRGTLTVANDALTFGATLSTPTASGPDQFPYNGFALYIDGPACVDARAYSRVAFILTGNLGTCGLQFAFAYAEDVTNASDSARGTCTTASCFSSQFAITTSTASVGFADSPTVLGMPLSVPDKARLTGIEFEFITTGASGCTASITVTNIRFQ
jgi:hypothetical protein